ncbi:MAG TPA: hypothetical protein VMR08_03865 [Patescibacteria group bacterium]|jgi:hypothetical protein|nr:hypothetical protein [Patescibacteria group bacterium]
MQKFKIILVKNWQKSAILAAVCAIAYGLVFFRLNRPALLSSQELSTYIGSHFIKSIFHYPLNAPYNLVENLILRLHYSLVFIRATSAIYAIIIILLLFYILKSWLGIIYAASGSVVFASSSWFLQAARFNSPNIMLLGFLAPVACGIWIKRAHNRSLAIAISGLAVGLVFYIPGLIWFILAGIISERKTLLRALKRCSVRLLILTVVLILIILSPLIWSFVQHPSTVRQFFAIPYDLHWYRGVLFNLIRIPGEIFWRGPFSPVHWLGRLPILNVFEAVMLLLGVLAFWQNRKLDRTRILLIGLLLGCWLVALNGPAELTVILPFLYVLIATGFVYVWELWRSVFPVNPFAKAAGALILTVAILFSCNYHTREYFVAWQNNADTKAVYTQKLPEI